MDELEQKNQNFFTSCKDCAFAEFDQDIQQGCKVGRLAKWENLGRVTKVQDEEKTFYQIDSFCNYLRPVEYMSKFPNAAAQVKIDSGTRVSVVINALGRSDDELVRIIDSLTAQTLRPCKIVVMHYKRRSPYGNVSTALKHSGIIYELVNLLDSDDYAGLMDAAAKKSFGQYITFTDESLPLDFIERINRVVNEDLRPLSLLTGKFLTVQLALYNMILGNLGQPIEDKIREMAERQNLQNMIMKYEDLYS